jgi:PAS domain S-box-containing protein/diguanylate cyclase (GGDEF)-like protein
LLAEGLTVLVDPLELHERARTGSSDVLLVDADEMRLEPEELRRLCSRHGDVRVILVARSIPADKALAFMRAGARDVLTREWLDCLPAVLERELGESARQRHLRCSGRLRAERAIARRERRFRRLVEHSADGFYVFDSGGNVLDANERGARLLGYTRDELLTLHVLDVDTAVSEEEFRAFCERTAAGSESRVETVYRRKDGTTFPVEVHTGLLDSNSEPLFLALAHDISERRRAQQQVAYLQSYDPVTQLPNREFLETLTELAVARAQRNGAGVGLLFVGLDDFRLVKETLGHSGSDELLRQASVRLREVAGTTHLVGRYGAEEFVLVATDLPIGEGDQVASLAARVQEAFSHPFSILGAEPLVGASIGIALFPLDGPDVNSLVDHAEVAMREARRDGWRPWRVFAGEPAGGIERLAFGTKLRGAVQRSELVLHYQPLVNLPSVLTHEGGSLREHIVGVEALVRWCDPERGMVSPSEFIPIAEEMGLTQPIADWVAAEVCRQSREWIDQGWKLDVAFNLTLHELRQPELVDRLIEEADRAGVPRDRLVLEVTESTAMLDSERTIAILDELRSLGFGLAIDDFGSGHSSLARLGQMPADRLKIDRSFVAGLPDDRTAATVVTAIIQLAENLGMKAVAEGIETRAQLEFLVAHNCPLGQGYLFSKPLPPAAVAAL